MNRIIPAFALTLLSALFVAGPAFCGQTADARFEAPDGRQLRARFDIPGKRVRVTLPDGARLTLPLALSASGARYSDGRATFWEHHGDVRVERDGKLIFKGREAALLERERPVRVAASRFLEALAREDTSFAHRFPLGRFRCSLESEPGGGARDALCVHEPDAVMVQGGLASVLCAAAPHDAAQRGAFVQLDDALWLLLRREAEGHWQGVAWFLGQGQPRLGTEAAQSLGLPPGALEAIGWRVATP